MLRTAFIAFFVLGLSAHDRAFATPISYSITFEVDYVVESGGKVTIGDKYFGSFTVDDAILATDGYNQPGQVLAFFVQTEEIVWDLDSPYPISNFDGFRGPGGLFADSPGFDVVGGEIVNLRGGLVGAGDASHVNFSTNIGPEAPIGFDPNCFGLYCGNQANQFYTVAKTTSFATEQKLYKFGGSMTVEKVPEPCTLGLLAAGLLRLVALRWRKPPLS